MSTIDFGNLTITETYTVGPDDIRDQFDFLKECWECHYLGPGDEERYDAELRTAVSKICDYELCNEDIEQILLNMDSLYADDFMAGCQVYTNLQDHDLIQDAIQEWVSDEFNVEDL